MIADVFTLSRPGSMTRFGTVKTFLWAVAAIIMRATVFVFCGAQGSMLGVVVFASADGAMDGVEGEFTGGRIMVGAPATATLFR